MRRKHRRGYQGRFTRLASRYRSLFTLVWTFLALLSVPGFNGSAHAQSATYRVTFEGKFTASALASGVSVPSGEHFTTLIGAVHNGGATFRSSGAVASAGVEAVAELGNTATFESEIKANMNAVAVIEKSLPGGGTPTATVDFTVTTAHPRVTLLTMIAPSPDWFVGVSGLSLLDAQGDWLASHTVDLFPYDAGTEEGTGFSLSNAATSPQGTITSIKGTGKFSNEPIATLTFTRQSVTPEITSETTFTVDEGTTAVEDLMAKDQDTAAADLAWSKAGGADAGQFTLSADGELAFAAAPDYENPDDADGDRTYEITVQVSDGDNTDAADIRVTLQNVTELLTELTGPSSTDYAENGAVRVAAYTASSDEDRNGITWHLGGDDDEHFSIDNPAGVLRFHIDPDADNSFPKLPDYEMPDDKDANNAYAVTVLAQAGSAFTSLSVTVTVTDENEAGAISLTTARPKAGSVLTATLTDPDGVTAGTVTWQWERSAGRNTWVAIEEAEDDASYMPTAADTGASLRVTATYTHSRAAGQTAQAVSAEVVAAELLRSLAVTTNASTAAASAFTVAGGSQSRTVSGVRVSGSTVEISSDPGSDRIYAPEDEIQATVTFSEPVDVERTPRLMLKVGDRDRPAGYLEGTGTTELVFGYEVVDGDEDTDGVSIEANRLSLNADPVLWYAMPAASWNEALPVGNGRLAGMVFGNTGRERIQLNEDTLWAGAPHQRDILGAHRHLPEIRRLLFAGRYVDAQAMVNRELFIGGRVVRAYQTLGDLWIDLGTESQAGYRRELDLETGIARTEWTRDGVAFTREVFASAPHGVLVVRIEADTPGAITGTVELTRPVDATTTAAGTELVLEGRASHGGQQLGVRFQARLRAVAEGGSAVAEGASLRLSGADAVTLILAAATDYRGTAPGPDAVRQVEAAEATGYTALREAHVADHRAIFNRVWLELGGSEWRREPTDTRLRFVRSGGEDTDLEAMYFQFGRYLLMASSRPGTMPANLQGVWNEAVEPPWNSDYHININIQMIYWPADVANLSEMQEPLWDMLDRLRERGRATARDHYGFERGFVAHHTTDAWWWTSPVGSARYGMWPSGGAWLSRHMWEAYLFNRDAAFLRERAYPVLKEAAEFFLDWLVPEPGTDLLLSGPSISPENAFRINGRRTHVTMGPAMDQQIVRDLFENVLAAAAELGIDDAFTQETAAKLAKLAGPQVGTDGRLMEWRQEELVEADPGHRHISHAFGLYPGSQFTVRGTPDLAAAVRKSIEHRVANGGGGTGWSLGWLLNMWARLEAGGKAYSTLRRLLTDMTMDNLLDLHPLLAGARTNVFQMDGNLGGTAGIAEMLLQSHAGEIHLLPALPRQWSRGVVEGLKARGGFEVSMAWSDGALTTVSIRSRSGEECRVRVAGGEVRTLAVGMGETRWFDGQLSEVRAPQGLGAPRDVAVTGSTPTSLSVTWQPPLFEGRSVHGYDVQYAKRGESGFREWPHRGRAPGTTITGLERDAAWKVRVRARNASGPGAWSSAVEYTGDIVAPVIDTIEITSNPGPDATYAAGDTIEVTVTFDETVKVEGTPRLTLRVGIRNRTAGYLRGTDTAALVFGYEVADGDEDTGGVSIEAGRIALNGGTIEDEAENAAELAHEALATQAGHKVDGVRPAFSSAAVDGASLTLTYGEALDGGSRPARGDFTVEVDGSGRSVSAVSVSGSVVTLTLDPAVEHGNTGIRVNYSPGTRPIRDAVGNDALGLSSQSVANTTGAPNTAPEITSPGSFDVPENQVLVRRLAARDDDPGDEVTGWEIVGGADRFQFSIAPDTGELSFRTAPDFEAPGDNEYEVTVEVRSGTGAREKTATQTITVTVRDDDTEAPDAPGAPTVSAASVTSLTVTWPAPDNDGPAITDYDVQYRAGASGGWTDAGHNGTAITATLTGLAEDTSHQVQVRATNDEGTGDWSPSGTGSTDANAAPAFDSSATFNPDESQTTAGTVVASDSDTEDDIEGYAIVGGADRGLFTINSGSGVLTFDSAPNYEDPHDSDSDGNYLVTVQATSGAGEREKTAEQSITVTVADVGGEKPVAPSAPSVSSASATSLNVTWSAPENAGPAITDYDYRHRTTSPVGNWTEITNTTITGLSATIGSLAEDTSYDVQVRATNDEGTGDWSPSGTGSTDANAAPAFDSSATFNPDESQTTAGTVVASDSDTEDDIEGYAIVGGADRGLFTINSGSGVLTFDSAPNYEDPHDSDSDGNYLVTVRATSGAGEREKTAEQSITVTVADVGGEKPAAPSAPSVSSASVTSLNVSWPAPANAGPAITDYDHRHRTTSPVGNWTEITNTTITGLSATIGSLAEDTSYDVQVRATNDEGTGDWSASGTGSTDASPLPDTPALDVAMVKGDELELRFDRPLDETSVPAPEDFAVVLDDGAGTPLPGAGGYAVPAAGLRRASAVGARGTPLAVTAVEVRGTTVVLTLEREVAHGTRVTVSYTPGAAPLRDEEGVAVPPIGGEAAVETALSVADARADEGDDVTFRVTLSPAVASPVTVDWALAPGSAAPGADYTGPLAGSLTIEGGGTAGTISVPTAQDAAVEGDETFTLTLTKPADFPHWALLKTATAAGMIEDDDDGDPRPPPPPPPGPGPSPPPSNRPPVATEEMTAQILELGDTLELDASEHFRDPDRRRMTFEAESADSAVATVEVDDSAVTVSAVDHGAAAVTVTAVDDRRARATQSFEVTVGRLVSFASEEVAAAEGDTATLTVAISRPRDAATSLDYVVGPDDDPATADADADDHDGMAGTVIIAAGATEATIAIAVRDDDDIEPPRETFAVTLQQSAEQARDFGLGVAAVRVRIDEGVCDRTPQVRDALRRTLPCARVSDSDLAGVRTLDLSDTGLAALRPGDFSGLRNLRALDVSGNSLASLPDGVFAGLGALSEARLQDNPGSPFVLRVELARTDGPASAPSPARLATRVRQGAPFPLRAGLRAVGGALSRDASLIATGMTESAPILVVREAAAGATRVELASTPLVPDTRCGRFGRYLCYRGFATVIGAPLVLFKDPPEVRGSVPATDLAAENDSIRISLSELFVAADGRPLRYAARSSDPGLAGAEVRGGVLIVVSGEDGREGTATITVTATDADGLSAELTFEVTLESMPRGFMSGWRRALIERILE